MYTIESLLFYAETIINQIENICVPFFFMISGYLLFRNFEMKNIVHKYSSRFFSLVVPYVLWCTIYYLFYFILIPAITGESGMGAGGVPMLGIPEYLWYSDFTVLWYVKYLILMMLPMPIYYFLFRITEKKWTYLLSICSFGILMALSMGILPCHIPYMRAEFIIGCYLGMNGKRFVENVNKVKTYIGVVGFMLLMLWLLMGNTIGAMWRMAMCGTIWFALDVFKIEKEPKEWMKISFFIYCAHELLLEVIEKIWLIAAGKSIWAAAIDYFFTPVIVVTILVMSGSFMKKYTPGVWKVLNGGR